MRSFDGTKAVKTLTVSLLGLLLAVLSISATAQAPNPVNPGSSGGYDAYANSYPAFGKQAFSPGSWSFQPTCLYWNSAVASISIATPGVVTVGNNCVAGQGVVFQTSSALPTGLTAGTVYYVIAAGLSTSQFEVSTTVGGSAVNTSGSQSGLQTVSAIYTNATVANTTVLVSPPVSPGFSVPGHCVIPYQESNASETFTLAASVSSTSAVLQVLNEAHTGSGGATVADLGTVVTLTTATSISSTIGGGTANTTYGDNIYFTLSVAPTATAPVTFTLYALTGSASYNIAFMPGTYCVLGS